MSELPSGRHPLGRHGSAQVRPASRPPLPPPRPPVLWPLYVVLFFFAVIVPVVVLKNAGRALPRWVFEARCEQTYRHSAYAQYGVPSFSYHYAERSTGLPARMDPVSQARERTTPATETRMVITDFSRELGHMRTRPAWCCAVARIYRPAPTSSRFAELRLWTAGRGSLWPGEAGQPVVLQLLPRRLDGGCESARQLLSGGRRAGSWL